MDEELSRRWRNSLAPFDGFTFSPDNSINDGYLSMETLLQVLIAIVDVLRERYSSVRLFQVSDWHEHDGLITPAKPTDWEEVKNKLVSVDSLLTESEHDTYVRTGIYPENHAFYLRFYVPDEWDQPFGDVDPRCQSRWGNFDITCHADFAHELEAMFIQQPSASVRKAPAKSFFDRFFGR
jgi:hypothetical protein